MDGGAAHPGTLCATVRQPVLSAPHSPPPSLHRPELASQGGRPVPNTRNPAVLKNLWGSGGVFIFEQAAPLACVPTASSTAGTRFSIPLDTPFAPAPQPLLLRCIPDHAASDDGSSLEGMVEYDVARVQNDGPADQNASCGLRDRIMGFKDYVARGVSDGYVR